MWSSDRAAGTILLVMHECEMCRGTNRTLLHSPVVEFKAVPSSVFLGSY